MPTSGSTQTFPETPFFSPMFSPGFGHPRGYTSSILDSSTRQHPSLKGRSSRASQIISGRSVSAKASMGTTRKKSWSKLKRSSTATANYTPAIHSSLSTATNCDTSTTMESDQAQFVDDLSTHPMSVSSDDSSDPEYFGGQRFMSALSFQRRLGLHFHHGPHLRG